MKKIFSIFSLAIIIAFSGCQDPKPTCKIISPYDGKQVLMSKDLPVTIEVKNAWNVTLYFDDYEMFSSQDVDEPFCYTRIPSQVLTLGKHTLKANARDMKDKHYIESTVIINVVESIDPNEKESPDFVTFANGKLPEGWITYSWEVANIGYDDDYSLKSANPFATVFTKKTMNADGYVQFYTKGENIDLYIDDADEKAQPLLSEPVERDWVKWIYPVDSGKHAFRWQTYGVLKYLDAIIFYYDE